jgi:hypothetical protein
VRRSAASVRGLAVAAVLCATLLLGCGGIKAPDLFVVQRSGSGPAAKLTLLVNEEGGVRCNGAKKLKLSDPQLVEARAIQEDIKEQASEHLVLQPAPRSVLSYSLRDEDGTVRFSDNSPHQPAVLRRLALFVLRTSQEVCHLPE